jgi:long-chain acyl-CoA synthetase
VTVPELSTLSVLAYAAARRYPKAVLLRRCLADRFDDISSAQFLDRTRHASLGLGGLGLQRGDRVALVSESRPEWAIADLGILSAGAVTVPIYPTLSASQAEYILNDSGARIVFASTAEQAAKIAEVRARVPAVEHVIVFDPGGNDAGALTLAELEQRGARAAAADPGLFERHRAGAEAVAAGDLATIIYTSGTTGDPKGVMLTHANIVSNVVASREILEVGPDDVALSFLPLSHAFERMVVYLYLACGVTVVFAESLETIARDLVRTRPTIVTGVPRVYEKIHARVLENVAAAPALRRRLFHWALGVGLRCARARFAGRRPGVWDRIQHGLADRLVFSKIRARTGGRVRYFVSGSAALPPAIAEFFEAAGLRIVEGYGLTETSPVLTVNPPDAPRPGTVGKPIRGVEIRIAEDGEILARGPNIMVGYYRKPEATAEALEGGWFHTGDVGRIDPDGYLLITDRKKDLLVTSGGKKVAPQVLESRLRADALVAEAVLVGEGRKFPAVLIVPDFAALAKRLAGAEGPREELIRRPDVLKLYQEAVDAANRGLAQFEQVKRFALLPKEFTIEGGELTPTLKVKRRVVEERYREVVEGLYR